MLLHLARLAITEEEAEKFAEQLGAITEFAEQLKRIRYNKCGTNDTCLTISKCNARRRSRKGLDR